MKLLSTLKARVFILFFSTFSGFAQAQVSIGLPVTTLNGSASLEVKPGPYPSGSPFRGLLVPNMAISQRNQIQNPGTGLLLYNTDNKQVEVNVGSPGAPVWAPAVGSGTAWSINGNNGTVDGTNFIGTGDNVPLNFRVFNQPAGRIDHILFNLGLGFFSINPSTTGTYNTALGSYTLRNNIAGIANTAVGAGALTTNSSGSANTGIGHDAMYSNMSGRENTAVGQSSLRSNTTGFSNTALGADAMNDANTSHDNTALGASAMYKTIDGYSNTAAGALALFANTSGYNNAALGNYALQHNVSGYLNSALGYNAGPSNNNITVNNSTAVGAGSVVDNVFSVAIGANATVNSNASNGGFGTAIGANSSIGVNCTNCTAIGGRAAVNANANNTIVLGDANITSLRCAVQSISTLSDKRIKEDVNSNVPGLNFIKKLNPVTYHINKYKEAKLVGYDLNNVKQDKTLHSGFLAQDVEIAAKQVGYSFEGVHREEQGRYYTIGYSSFVVPLVQAVKDLSAEVDRLKSELRDSKTGYNKLVTQIEDIQKMLHASKIDVGNAVSEK